MKQIAADNIRIQNPDARNLSFGNGRVRFRSTVGGFAFGDGSDGGVRYEGTVAIGDFLVNTDEESLRVRLLDHQYSAPFGFGIQMPLMLWDEGITGASQQKDPDGFQVPGSARKVAEVVGLQSTMVAEAGRGIKDAAKVVKWAGRVGGVATAILLFDDINDFRQTDQSWGDYGKLSVSATAAGLVTFGKHPIAVLSGVVLGVVNEFGGFNSVYDGLDTWNYINNLNKGNNRIRISN